MVNLMATVTAEAARDGAAAMVAVGQAGAPKEGDPVDPGGAMRARVKRAEDAVREALRRRGDEDARRRGDLVRAKIRRGR